MVWPPAALSVTVGKGGVPGSRAGAARIVLRHFRSSFREAVEAERKRTFWHCGAGLISLDASDLLPFYSERWHGTTAAFMTTLS